MVCPFVPGDRLPDVLDKDSQPLDACADQWSVDPPLFLTRRLSWVVTAPKSNAVGKSSILAGPGAGSGSGRGSGLGMGELEEFTPISNDVDAEPPLEEKLILV